MARNNYDELVQVFTFESPFIMDDLDVQMYTLTLASVYSGTGFVIGYMEEDFAKVFLVTSDEIVEFCFDINPRVVYVKVYNVWLLMEYYYELIESPPYYYDEPSEIRLIENVFGPKFYSNIYKYNGYRFIRLSNPNRSSFTVSIDTQEVTGIVASEELFFGKASFIDMSIHLRD